MKWNEILYRLYNDDEFNKKYFVHDIQLIVCSK